MRVLAVAAAFATVFVPPLAALEIAGQTIPKAHAAAVESALARAGDNATELRTAFEKVPEGQLAGLSFLVAHMPERDLRGLKAAYLLENLDWAYRARNAVPWGKSLDEELFLNDVLPYASINERRDSWRKDFYERFLPLVKDCKTPGEAAQALNKQMWGIVDVRYHANKRPKPDQSPYESMDAKFASCSGLSVLLIDACRSVCVPARFVGTPLWANKRGNHSWVEVWDGDWKFTGACEYSAAGLNRGWFAGSAATAVKDDWRHSIYASSWKKGGTHFPLVWDLDIKYVNAENVTDRYAAKVEHKVFIEVFAKPGGERVASDVEVWSGGEKIGAGRTRDAGNDTNDLFGIVLKPGREHELRVVRADGGILKKTITPGGKKDEIVELFLKGGE